jgi:hypothetical protein
MTIARNIAAWFGDYASDPHSRYRSWEHCYAFFQREQQAGVAARLDEASLQLGFYLASWGMYRGSSSLLQRAYTVHLSVVEGLTQPRFAPLWTSEFGSAQADHQQVPLVLEMIEVIRNAYRRFGQPTDTLVTKVILGTLGCLPACDRYFRVGFKSEGFKYSSLNERFVKQVLDFSLANLVKLQSEQNKIRRRSGVRYPLMKLVDMHFHAAGWRDLQVTRVDG